MSKKYQQKKQLLINYRWAYPWIFSRGCLRNTNIFGDSHLPVSLQFPHYDYTYISTSTYMLYDVSVTLDWITRSINIFSYLGLLYKYMFVFIFSNILHKIEKMYDLQFIFWVLKSLWKILSHIKSFPEQYVLYSTR